VTNLGFITSKVNKAKTSLPKQALIIGSDVLYCQLVNKTCANQHQGHLHVFSGSAATRISALSKWRSSSSMSHG